jgi:hypothetical protein
LVVIIERIPSATTRRRTFSIITYTKSLLSSSGRMAAIWPCRVWMSTSEMALLLLLHTIIWLLMMRLISRRQRERLLCIRILAGSQSQI